MTTPEHFEVGTWRSEDVPDYVEKHWWETHIWDGIEGHVVLWHAWDRYGDFDLVEHLNDLTARAAEADRLRAENEQLQRHMSDWAAEREMWGDPEEKCKEIDRLRALLEHIAEPVDSESCA